MSDPRQDDADRAAELSGLKKALDLIVAHGLPGPEKTECLRCLSLLIGALQGCATRRCKECGVPFVLLPADVRRYKDAGLTTPVRCGLCRRQRRHERAEREQALDRP